MPIVKATDIIQFAEDMKYILSEEDHKLIVYTSIYISRLLIAGDMLANAVNDEHHPQHCEIDCPSRAAVVTWQEARRG